MRVILRRTFFAGGNRYRKSVGGTPTEVPERFRKILPKDAVICDEPATKKNVPVEDAWDDVPPEDAPYVNPAHELDQDRAFAEALSEANNKASKEVDDIRSKVKKAVKGS